MPPKAKRESDRYQEWYEKNRARILKARRKRYRKDSTYRSRQRQRNRERYWLTRAAEVQRTVRRRVVTASFTVAVDGETKLGPTMAYGLADVAALFGRTTRTALLWLQQGVLPQPLHVARERKSIRVYLPEEFELIRECAPLVGQPKKSMAKSVFARTLKRRMHAWRLDHLDTYTSE